ncbi:hypothetical protein [Facklamia miroungae]|uniref:Uncharacterized protein n=1 Tax=Facklamia miroungae TaxID=120956 RepID=A0A1G7NWU0_9LACT|nr:hypothetical protein [Facklamia miroungae]NKZ28494.1 hypothetical protein [Facklamia miroungae]SDF78431.1 hypothetical protein SAMN05421791_10134 [Facklamia miroungae]
MKRYNKEFYGLFSAFIAYNIVSLLLAFKDGRLTLSFFLKELLISSIIFTATYFLAKLLLKKIRKK